MISSIKENFLDRDSTSSGTSLSDQDKFGEPLSIDEIIDRALNHCTDLPYSCNTYVSQIRELKTRLANGKLHLAVLGQFNRGKSTFLNALIGLKVLPTSVLPITSVPTIISYGDNISCRVRFLDQKPDLVITQSLASIQEGLKHYVAEENNPNNQLCVKEVEVTCKSSLLENGTVLLDTPGFGSTHIHNTRVALTTLTECDAAIFLLSADPPLTQTELEFLKQVNLYVPRIFFVLNKIDLLTHEELLTIDRFIKNVLIMQMKYPADLKLFHICAREGEKAQGDPENKSWNSSGMNVVKTEILDFMVREKYFTLSQALNEKFHEALSGIDACISEEINSFTQPVELLKKEYTDITNHTTRLRKLSEKEIALIQVEENAVVKYLEEQITAGTANLQEELLLIFDKLVTKSAIKTDTIKSLYAAFNNIIEEKIDNYYLTQISNCNKPIRKAIQIHTSELSRFVKEVHNILGEVTNETWNITELIEHCEIKPEKRDLNVVIDLSYIPEWNTLFRNRSDQVDRYKKQFHSTLGAIIPQQLKLIEDSIREQIQINFKKIYDLLNKNYKDLLKVLENSQKKKDTAIQERTNAGGTRSMYLSKIAEEFKAIRKMLL